MRRQRCHPCKRIFTVFRSRDVVIEKGKTCPRCKRSYKALSWLESNLWKLVRSTVTDHSERYTRWRNILQKQDIVYYSIKLNPDAWRRSKTSHTWYRIGMAKSRFFRSRSRSRWIFGSRSRPFPKSWSRSRSRRIFQVSVSVSTPQVSVSIWSRFGLGFSKVPYEPKITITLFFSV